MRPKDVESFLNKENNKVELPQGLIDVLNSISLSTSRGVMFTLFRGTWCKVQVSI